ncbi:hypothetical protein [Alicyclobacillus ferrooxydans]|uniref:Uncharacterized protein n=1 Tax=Alicyclobacillus ferrooxydans TaxID=471514 RepID=A0A0P9CK06_9BACL|nr:hypothetical protein [Alicyclobacillus ferrooxydans]KPV45602.1 hypothetical protein AN477_01365 [Alicyclobacillus ferrooxydans]
MNAFWDDFRKARNLNRWQRLLRKRDAKRTPVRIILMGIVGLFMLFSVGSASVSPLMAVRGDVQGMNGFVVFASVLAGAFLLYIQLVVVYQRLVVEDSSIMLVAPITGRAILMFRLLEGFNITLFFSLLGLPMIAAYLWLSHAPWIAYLIGLAAIWASAWLIVSVALLLMTLLLRIIRRPISRDMLGVFSSLVAIAILLGTRVLVHDAVGSAGGPGGTGPDTLFANWLSPGFIYLPLSWFGYSLIGLGSGITMGFVYFLFILIFTAVVAGLTFSVGSPILHERLTQLSDAAALGRRQGKAARKMGIFGLGQQSEHATGTRQGRQQADQGTLQGRYQADRDTRKGRQQADFDTLQGRQPANRGRLIWEVTRKDLLRLRRTPVDLANYLFPTAYLLYFATQPAKVGGGALFGLLPVFILVLASTMGRVPISSFGLEGEQVWLYLQAPAPSNTILWAKWLYGTLPTLLWWEVLCVLLAVFHALSVGLAVLLGVAGFWLIPGAVALTLPFAIHGAAFIPRMVGRRNRYVNARSAWYILVIFPYLLLQVAALGAVSIGLLPSVSTNVLMGGFIHQLQSVSWLMYAGLLASILITGVGTLIGRSMGLEAWRNKRIQLYETGSLDGQG